MRYFFYFIIVTIIFLFPEGLNSQSQNPLDSLLGLLNKSKDDSVKAKLLSQITEVCEISDINKYANEVFNISKKYENSSNQSERNKFLGYKATAINNIAFVYDASGDVNGCISKYKEALLIREQIKDTNAIGNTLFNLAVLYKNTGKYSEALPIAKKALLFLKIKKNYIGVSKCLFTLGSIYYNIGKIKEAIESFENSLVVSKKNNDIPDQNDALTGLGFIYGELGELDKEYEYLSECLSIQKKLNDAHGLAYSYNNIGFIYNKKNAFLKAKECFKNSLKYALETNELEAVALAYHNIGNSYRLLNNVDSAFFYYQKSIDLRDKINDEGGKSLTLVELGSLNLSLKKNNIALKYFENAYQIGLKLNQTETIRKSADFLSSLYFTNKEFKKAYQMQVIFKQYSDSLFNQENKKAAYKKQIKMDYEKKEAEIKLIAKLENEKIQSQANSERKRQRLIIYFISAVLVLVFLVALFIYKNYNQKQKANKLLQEKNNLIEFQKKEVEMQKSLIEEHQKETIDSINYAKKIQYALLANDDLLKKNLSQYFVLFNPKDIVSGDFYWATEHQNRFYLAVCDSTGHGVPGAFMSLLNMGFLAEAINEKNIEQPHEIFNYVRQRLINSISSEGQKDGMDGILICIDRLSNQISYTAANNDPILISNSQIIELPKNKMPVGKGEKTDSFTTYTINCMPGDVLCLYTDGYADQFGGPKGKKFKYKQLNDLLLEVSIKSMNEQKEILATTFSQWKGSLEQVDDVLIIGIKL
ncbi:MAG: tetratricopeptide repeat protein [Bacteroidia bacterium]